MEIRRSGDDLVVREDIASPDVSTFGNFYGHLEDDAFGAGAYYGAREITHLHKDMQVSNGEAAPFVAFVFRNYEIFSQALIDTEQWRGFNRGWLAAWTIPLHHAFDREEDVKRRHVVRDALEYCEVPLTRDTLDDVDRVARYIKNLEVTELLRGIVCWFMDIGHDRSGYDNFGRLVSGMEEALRDLSVDASEYEPDSKLDGAAVLIADAAARRKSESFRIGQLVINEQHSAFNEE